MVYSIYKLYISSLLLYTYFTHTYVFKNIPQSNPNHRITCLQVAVMYDKRLGQVAPETNHQIFFIEHSGARWLTESVFQMDSINFTGHKQRYYAPEFSQATTSEIAIANRTWKNYKKNTFQLDATVPRRSRKSEEYRALWVPTAPEQEKSLKRLAPTKNFPIVILDDDDVTDDPVASGSSGKGKRLTRTRSAGNASTSTSSEFSLTPLANTESSTIYNQVHGQTAHVGMQMTLTAIKLQEENLNLKAMESVKIQAAVSEANFQSSKLASAEMLAEIRESMKIRAEEHQSFLEKALSIVSGQTSQQVSPPFCF